MTSKAKIIALALFVLSQAAASDLFAGDIALILLVVTIVAGWRAIDGFWLIGLSGLVAGAAAGLLILGPGYRLAMRIVAILDPTRAEEFSVEGTLFILIGIGLILGALNAATFSLPRRAFGVSSPVVAGGMLATVQMLLLTFASGELSEEIFELGLGAWVNIPLFALFTFAFAVAAMALADVVEGRLRERRRGTAAGDVPALTHTGKVDR